MDEALLSERILRCEQCPDSIVDRSCAPVERFGADTANAWLVGINPSGREYYDRRGEPLQGERRRFLWLGEQPRAGVPSGSVAVARGLQSQYFWRSPYRPYFSRLGRFLLNLHGYGADADPLLPFRDGVVTPSGNGYLYAHLDTVKCATVRPWGKLLGPDRGMLQETCAPYLVQQIWGAPWLRLVVINGRSAMESVLPLLRRNFDYEGHEEQVRLGGRRATVAYGHVLSAPATIRLIAWSPNVVNQRLTAGETGALSQTIAEACPWLR